MANNSNSINNINSNNNKQGFVYVTLSDLEPSTQASYQASFEFMLIFKTLSRMGPRIIGRSHHTHANIM